MCFVWTIFCCNDYFNIIIQILACKRIVSVEVNDFCSSGTSLQRELCIFCSKLAAKVCNILWVICKPHINPAGSRISYIKIFKLLKSYRTGWGNIFFNIRKIYIRIIIICNINSTWNTIRILIRSYNYVVCCYVLYIVCIVCIISIRSCSFSYTAFSFCLIFRFIFFIAVYNCDFRWIFLFYFFRSRFAFRRFCFFNRLKSNYFWFFNCFRFREIFWSKRHFIVSIF